jgi:hypothetical protein
MNSALYYKNNSALRVLVYGFFAVLCFGCTLTKDELIQMPDNESVELTLGYTITGNKTTEYAIIILRDTVDLYSQVPLFFGNNAISIRKDTLRKGVWVLFKKWLPNDSVFESKPYFISLQIPATTKKMQFNFDTDIPVLKRKAFYELESVHFKIYNYSNSWDKNSLDDAVSGPLPDVYFKLDNLFTSGYTEFIDQPTEKIAYTFKKHIKISSLHPISLWCFDYDFNVSPDDIMDQFAFNPSNYQGTDANYGIFKMRSIPRSWWSDPSEVLTVKIF